MAAGFYAYDEADFFRIADALGARTLNVIQMGSEMVPNGQVIDSLASLCERAKHHGLIVSVEFLPWSPIPNLGQALELVNATGQTNCGVNIDTWHHFRSGGTIEQLAALNPASIAAIQLNDVAARPWDNLLEETMLGRLLPGEGCSNTAAVLKAFEQAGVEVPINIEVFSSELQQLPPEQVALKAAESMRRVMSQAKRL
jgi:sugar phosphate isomerase/epimerase